MKSFKYRYLFLISSLFLLLLLPTSVSAVEDGQETTPLCPPGIYMNGRLDCVPLGPSQYLTEMARKGITFPQTPLPLRNPDPGLNHVNYEYAYVDEDRAPIYKTLEDAVKSKQGKIVRKLLPGFNYVSFTKRVYQGGTNYFKTKVGWMSAKHVTPTTIPDFQGIEFTQTPGQPFGWVLDYFSQHGKVETKRTPGYGEDDYTGHVLRHLELVQIFDVQKVGRWNWYLIGPDEWIVQTSIAKVTPDPAPPGGNEWDRWIEVNLYEQTLSVYENGELIFATLMATGVDPYWTYPGTFRIYEKIRYTDMRGTFAEDKSDWYYLENVPWTMYFDDRRALHGAYWRARLGYPQSHGCVNLSVGDARWLYEWAQIGDLVYVHDPSGKTPSNPDL